MERLPTENMGWHSHKEAHGSQCFTPSLFKATGEGGHKISCSILFWKCTVELLVAHTVELHQLGNRAVLCDSVLVTSYLLLHVELWIFALLYHLYSVNKDMTLNLQLKGAPHKSSRKSIEMASPCNSAVSTACLPQLHVSVSQLLMLLILNLY